MSEFALLKVINGILYFPIYGDVKKGPNYTHNNSGLPFVLNSREQSFQSTEIWCRKCNVQDSMFP